MHSSGYVGIDRNLCYFDVAQSYSHICAKRELDRSREGLWGKPNLNVRALLAVLGVG